MVWGGGALFKLSHFIPSRDVKQYYSRESFDMSIARQNLFITDKNQLELQRQCYDC